MSLAILCNFPIRATDFFQDRLEFVGKLVEFLACHLAVILNFPCSATIRTGTEEFFIGLRKKKRIIVVERTSILPLKICRARWKEKTA